MNKRGKVYKLKQERLGLPKGTELMVSEEWDYGVAHEDTLITGIKHVSMMPPRGGPTITVTKEMVEEKE